MEFLVLGPLDATESGSSVPLAGGKQRALLALLLVNAGRVVGVERIVDDLWGEDVPETAPKMVQIFVSQLRKQLPDGLLVTRAPGYAAELDGHGLDLREFEALHSAGRAALAARRLDDAAGTLREALALWRGPALAEFDEPFARVESARLEEARLACLEERVEADLALGRHAELVGELDALVRRHPRRERLRSQHLLALYRSGRQAEALDGYRAFRQELDDELGIEPSASLKELERRMLRQDPELDAAPAAAPARPVAPAAARAAAAVPALAGRERELGFLGRLLDDARGGTRRLAFVTGDTGIGKTAVVEAFEAAASADGDTLVARGQSVEHRGAGEPYLPVLEALGRLCRGPAGGELRQLLVQQAPTWLAQMPWLLDDSELEAVRRRLLGANHERMLREMLEALDAVTARATLVLVLEDLHWSDPSTVDLLDALARRPEPARLLVVGTYRRGDAAAQGHPVHRLAGSLRGRGLCTEIAVGPLDEGAVADVLRARLAGEPATGDVSRLLWERTGGNPLFVSTLVDSWLADGLLAADGTAADPARLAGEVPETVRELIEQSLLQLDPADHELLAAASVAGQEFAVAAAAAAAERTEDDVDARFDALARTGRFLEPAGEDAWPDGTLTTRYRFGHDMHRAVLYDRLPPGRRARLHGLAGARLEAAYGERAREIGAQLAEHFVASGDAGRAVGALRLAGEQALERLAPREALDRVEVALGIVERLPEGPARGAQELALQSMLGAAKIAAQGWSAPEAEAAFLRAHELAEQLGRTEDSGRMLFQLGSLYEIRAEYERAEAVLERAFAACGPAASPGLLTDSHEVLACSLFHQGVFSAALEHAERGLEAYDGSYVNAAAAALGDHSGSGLLTWAALALWFLGRPDSARDRARSAVALTGDDPLRHGQATALAHAAIISQLRREPDEALEQASGAVELSRRSGYRYRLGMATVLRGWALAAQGAHEEGIAEVEGGLEISRSTGGHMDDPYYLTLLADAQMRAGQLDASAATVVTALEQTPRGRRTFFYRAELYRLEGELAIAAGRRDEGEARLRSALELAASQGARSLELRAATSLGRVLERDGAGEEARELVREVYESFEEGHDTHDLVEARALLEGLPAAVR